MIVADTNLIVHFLVQVVPTQRAERVFNRDSQWSAPLLWRSEFRNVLTVYMRHGLLSLDEALEVMQRAEILMQGREYEIPSTAVLRLAAGSRCSAYDCEFVALAQNLGVSMVTADRKVLSEFPATAVSVDAFSA